MTTRLAETVFNIPELLERILRLFGAKELLTLHQVNKLFFHTIEGSLALQQQMGQVADTKRGYRLLVPSALPNVQFHTLGEFHPYFRKTTAELNKVDFKATLRTPFTIPKLGARSRRVLICQPPVVEMKIYAACCTYARIHLHAPDEGTPAEVLRVETGITCGDMINAAARVAEEHKLCPLAHAHMHDAEGFVHLSLIHI